MISGTLRLTGKGNGPKIEICVAFLFTVYFSPINI
jgi:hypothetical protein